MCRVPLALACSKSFVLPTVLKPMSLICTGEVSYPVCRWQTETTKVRCVQAVLATCIDLHVPTTSDAFKIHLSHTSTSRGVSINLETFPYCTYLQSTGMLFLAESEIKSLFVSPREG